MKLATAAVAKANDGYFNKVEKNQVRLKLLEGSGCAAGALQFVGGWHDLGEKCRKWRKF